MVDMEIDRIIAEQQGFSLSIEKISGYIEKYEKKYLCHKFKDQILLNILYNNIAAFRNKLNKRE